MAQVRRASWTVIGLTPAFLASRLPGALEVARLDGCAIAGGEYEVCFVPCLAGGCSCLIALFLSELEGGQADVGQGESGVGRLGLGVPVEELSAYALQLAADGQLSGVEVDVCPGESERFVLAQSGDEDQGVGGVEEVLVCSGGLQELPRLVARPGLAPPAADGGEGDRHGGVLGDEVFGLGVGEGGPQRGSDVADRARGRDGPAAAADSAAAPLVLRPGGVLALGAALAGPGHRQVNAK
nr:hypothetical protein [Micromonospora sp. WMMC415]